jgi:hypothetical protein
LPSDRAIVAAEKPALPAPTTQKSYSCFIAIDAVITRGSLRRPLLALLTSHTRIDKGRDTDRI